MRNTLLFLLSLPVCAAAADWLTFAGDPQRTGWAREESTLTRDNVKGLKLDWSRKLDNVPKEMNSLTVPVVMGQVITPRGFKELLFIAGSSDKVWAIDADTGQIFWTREFSITATPKQKPGWLCPNSLNATPVIDKRERTLYVVTSDGKLRSLSIVTGEDRGPAAPFVPEFSKPWSLNLVDGVLYAPIGQGCNGAKNAVYAMDVKDPRRPVFQFQSTTTGGAGIWGRAGVAAGFDGRIYAETGDGPYDPAAGKWADTFLALTARDLSLADYYTPANRAWITKKDLDMGCMSPVVFKFGDRELVAGAGKEGVLFLLDAKSLGGADHRTPLYRSPLITNEEVHFAGRGMWGALSTWEEQDGTRWLYVPAWGPPASTAPKFPLAYGETPDGSVMAFRIVERDGKPVPEAAWMSVNMSMAEPVVIANGIVFALSNGENARQVDEDGRLLPTARRAEQPSGNAVLYALDAKTGKALYSSGKTIPGWTHLSGLAVNNGRVYVVTHDSHVYAFGVPQ